MSRCILKLGSSVLGGVVDLATATREIARSLAGRTEVIVVVSAFGDTTDRLCARARQVDRAAQGEAVARLVATGESEAAALVALALGAAGIPAAQLDPAEAGLRTRGPSLDGELVACDRARFERELARTPVVVVPGFVGRGARGATTLLGRGGSDFTALFLAARLDGCCTLLKDTDGLYTADPRRDRAARRFVTASWATALAIGGGVVQEKALHFAAASRLEFAIAAPGGHGGTRIGALEDRLAGEVPTAGRVRA